MEFIPVNKYLCHIIDQYVNVDIDDLVSYIPKFRSYNEVKIKNDLSLTDIIVKSIHRGYRGITVHCDYIMINKHLESMKTNNILIENYLNIYYYSFLKDERNLPLCDFLCLDIIVYDEICELKYEKSMYKNFPIQML